MKSRFTITFLAVILLHSNSQAQNIWMNDYENSVSLEILKPSISNQGFGFIPEYSFLSSISFISTNISINDKLNFYGELPLIYTKTKGNGFFESESKLNLGNVYIGIQTKNADKPTHLEFGLRLPSSNVNVFTNQIAVLTDQDRLDAVFEDIIAVPFKFVHIKTLKNGGFLKLRGGGDLWIATNDDNDTEFLLDYSFQYGKSSESVDVLLGLTGFLIVSEEDLNLSERIVQHFGISAKLTKGKVNPGILFKLPLDNDLNNVLDYTVGINLTHRF